MEEYVMDVGLHQIEDESCGEHEDDSLELVDIDELEEGLDGDEELIGFEGLENLFKGGAFGFDEDDNELDEDDNELDEEDVVLVEQGPEPLDGPLSDETKSERGKGTEPSDESVEGFVFEKGMTIEEFARENPENRNLEDVRRFFTPESIDKEIKDGTVLVKRGKIII